MFRRDQSDKAEKAKEAQGQTPHRVVASTQSTARGLLVRRVGRRESAPVRVSVGAEITLKDHTPRVTQAVPQLQMITHHY